MCVSPSSPDGTHSEEGTPDPSQAIYAEFDDDFEEEEEELVAPIGQCTAMYNFPGRCGWVTMTPMYSTLLWYNTLVHGDSVTCCHVPARCQRGDHHHAGGGGVVCSGGG